MERKFDFIVSESTVPSPLSNRCSLKILFIYLLYGSFISYILILFLSLSLHICPPPLHTCQIKQTLREKKGEKHKMKKGNLIMEAAAWHRESLCEPLCPYIFTCKCSLQRDIGLVWGLQFLSPYRCWALTRVSLGYCVVTLSWGDPAALGLQIRSLHMLQKILDGMDDGASQVLSLCLGLGSCRVGHHLQLQD